MAPITVLIAGIQILFEGSRWEMVPAYALTIIFFLFWLLGIVKPSAIHVNRLFAGVGVGLAVLALGASIALPTVLPVFHFPKPSGPYQIGTVTYHWVESRHEIFNTDPNAHRQLMVQIWYPVKGDNSPARAPYVQGAGALSPTLARLAHLPGFTLDHFQYVTTNAIPSAPVATDKHSYPVLIFLEGLNGFRQMNTFQIEEFGLARLRRRIHRSAICRCVGSFPKRTTDNRIDERTDEPFHPTEHQPGRKSANAGPPGSQGWNYPLFRTRRQLHSRSAYCSKQS